MENEKWKMENNFPFCGFRKFSGTSHLIKTFQIKIIFHFSFFIFH